MGRRRSGSITIDVCEVLHEVDDADLIAEIEERGIELDLPNGTVLAREAYDELRIGRVAEARALLERLLFPKWSSRESCLNAYDMFKKSA